MVPGEVEILLPQIHSKLWHKIINNSDFFYIKIVWPIIYLSICEKVKATLKKSKYIYVWCHKLFVFQFSIIKNKFWSIMLEQRLNHVSILYLKESYKNHCDIKPIS
jgi:hypothetical protein